MATESTFLLVSFSKTAIAMESLKMANQDGDGRPAVGEESPSSAMKQTKRSLTTSSSAH